MDVGHDAAHGVSIMSWGCISGVRRIGGSVALFNRFKTESRRSA
jgi:hypothetical protein